MKKKLIKLLLPTLAILAGFFCLYFLAGQEHQNPSPFFIILIVLLVFGGSAIFIFFWVDVGDELRQSPSVLVYIITFVFFGIPQLILGIFYIVVILVTAFPLGLFSLHKTLPQGGEHIRKAFSWPGRQKQVYWAKSSEALTQKLVQQRYNESVKKEQKLPSKEEGVLMSQVAAAKPDASTISDGDMHDYASYIEKMSKR